VAGAPASEALAHVERHRNDEDGDRRRRQHAAQHGGAEDAPGVRAGAGRQDQRHHAEDERERRHEDRPEPQPRGGQRGVHEARATLVLLLGELHDQDGVLRREADDHHEADLREHVELEAGDPERADRAQQRDRGAEQDAERQRPAFVLRRQQQEHDEQREAEDGGGRDAFLGDLLLERHARVVEPHLARHRLGEDLLERPHPLSRADARREHAVDLRRTVAVEAHRELRAVHLPHADERGQWQRLPGGVAHVELPDVLRPRAELPLGLHVDLPDAPVLVEVVHERAAQERLQGLVHGRQRDALLEDLVAIHLREVLGRARQQRREEERELRTLPRGGE
jgi:hypothetical protein